MAPNPTGNERSMKRRAQHPSPETSAPKVTRSIARSTNRLAFNWHGVASQLGEATSRAASGSKEPVYNLRRGREAYPRASTAPSKPCPPPPKPRKPEAPHPRHEVLEDEVLPRPRRSTKRPMPPAPEGRVPKRRRTSDDVEAGSSQQPSRWVKKAKRATGELRKLLREANGVHELVTKTEQAIARASESVKNMVHDVDMLDARRTASSRANRTRQSTAVPIHSTPAHETASLPSVPRSGTDAEKTSDLQAALVALIKARVDENKDTDKRSMDGVLRSVLDALIDADPRENTTCCTCRPTASQRRRIEETKFSKPRPRIGADAQGFPYDDRSACSMSDPHPDRLTSKERNVEKMLALGRPDPFMDSLPGLSVRPRPRAPRVFKQQFTVQFQHLPPGVLAEMERWHVELGRCGNCIMRAMRTFPPWIIEVEWPAVAEDGCPVYENRAKAEVAEWDEERRQWRHLILDHYRWIPVEELEERPSDSAADPEVVNGTAHASIPWDALIDYDALNE